MTDDDLRELSRRFDELPEIGRMPDGEAIRDVPGMGHLVREPSGYFCSPVAYSVRLEVGGREWFTPPWCRT